MLANRAHQAGWRVYVLNPADVKRYRQSPGVRGKIERNDADAIVAYSGLDPRPNDSGQHRGRRRITKRGPPEMRRLLFLAAQAAAKSKAARPVYEAIRAKGFSTTQALVILARNLLRVAYLIWKTGQPFDPQRILPPAACQKP